ncbi:MAG: CHAT domain-containing protein [Myxococcota bacterium]
MRRSRRHPAERRRLGAPLVALVVAACSKEPPPPPAPASPSTIVLGETPTVEVRGCRSRQGPKCVVRAGRKGTATLNLWIDADASATLQATADGQPLELQTRPVDGGQHVVLRPPSDTAVVQLGGIDPQWPEPFALPLQWTSAPPILGEAKALGKAEGYDREIQVLTDALPTLEPEARLAVLQRLRRLHDNTGAVDEGTKTAERAAALARTLGADRDLADIASAIAYRAILDKSLHRAQQWIERLEQLTETVSEARSWAPYYRGLLLSATGDLHTAVAQIAEAERRADRLGMFSHQATTLEQHAVLLGELGRTEEAMAVVQRGMRLADSTRLRCHMRRGLLGNLGWAQLRMVQMGHTADVPWETFERSLQASEHECPDPTQAVNQRVNLAIAALVEGDFEHAHDRYQQLRADGVPQWLEPWVAEIGAQVALATGRWEQAPPLLARTPPSGELGLDWSVAVRRGALLTRLGLDEAAIEAYAAAEGLLDEASASGGTGVGAENFLWDRSASAWGLVQRLVARGQRTEALCRARMARRRALRRMDRAARIAGLPAAERTRWEQVSFGLLETRAELQAQAREDWTLSETQQINRRARRSERHLEATAAFEEATRTLLLEPPPPSCEQLPPVPSGERVLLILSHQNQSLAFVGDDAGRVEVAQLPSSPGPTRWTPETLETFSEALHGATRIRIMADGRDRDPTLAKVRVGDRTLLDVAPLVHALDLPPRPAAAVDSRRAIVVADPSQNLPAARNEARAVEQTLVSAGWQVGRHDGEGATRANVLESLKSAALLHYAGHGAHRGAGGWDAALLLHGGELGVIDLLAVSRVPPAVILAGCDTGSHSAGAWAGGVNLGRAFVLAGAQEVLAASGTLDDQLALRVGEGIAEQLAQQPKADLAAALRAVQLELRVDAPSSSWATLHVLVP